MNIQEAIKHCEEKTDCTECGQEHAQLAEWLTEYLELKERDKAIPAKDKYDFSGFYIGECPSCGTGIDSKSNFCFNCG